MHDKIKALKALIKEFDQYSVHAFAAHNRESYSDAATIEISGYSRPLNGSTDFERKATVTLKGEIRKGSTSRVESYLHEGREYPKYPDHYRPLDGYWGTIYREELKAIVDGFPKDLEPRVRVGLDYGTNELCIKAKLHADHLIVYGVNEDGEQCKFLLDSCVSAHNTARFGTPYTENDQVGRGLR